MEQLVREVAYTHLNRLAAYKIMEQRGLIREAVSRGLAVARIQVLPGRSPGRRGAVGRRAQDRAYRHFLGWLGAR